jgi:hypothetical protein
LLAGGIAFAVYSIVSSKSSGINNEQSEKKHIQRYYQKCFHKYSVEVPTQNNFAFYAELGIGSSKDYFFAVSVDTFLYPANENQIIPLTFNNEDFTLVNVNFPFLNRKENIIPFLNAVYLIKIIYLYDLLKFRTYLTDALRTYKDQMKYNRRGWSTVDKSPHMAGIASDMGRYFGPERKIIESESGKLGLRFMQHGGRGNVHIHLQDNTLWHSKDFSDNLIKLSEEIHIKAETKNNIIAGYEKTDNWKTHSGKYFKRTGYSLRHFEKGNTYRLNFSSLKPVLLKSEIYTVLGIKIATIYSGIYKNDKNTFLLDLKFLPPGVYKIKNFGGQKLIKEEIITRF